MATTGATLVAELSRRLRDPNNERHGTTLVVDVLSQSQRLINFATEAKTTTVTFTPSAGRTLYRTSELDGTSPTNVMKVTAIRQSNRDLIEVAWRSLGHVDVQWLRRQGARYEVFARIGGNLVVIAPAMSVPQPLEITYVAKPAAVVNDATAIDLADEFVPAILDLAELTLATRVKQFDGLSDIIFRLNAELSLESSKEQ